MSKMSEANIAMLCWLGAIGLIVLAFWLPKHIIARRKEKKEERIIKLNRERAAAEMNANIERFMENDRTIKLAEQFAVRYIGSLKSLNRRGYEQTTVTHKETIVFERGHLSKIRLGDETFDFQMNNISAMKDPEEMKALVRAIAILAKGYIEKNYPLDSSGTAYTLEIYESGDDWISSSFGISFCYKAPNGFYKPSTAW